LQYIKCIPKEYQDDNFFAQWGSFIHVILEKYYNRSAEIYELSSIYEKEYRNHVTHPAPPNEYVDLNLSYYIAGKNYFDNFTDIYENCEILGVEKEINVNIDGYKFTGYADLIVKSDDGIHISDNKSKKSFKDKKEQEDYFRQLYLYSLYIKDEYGEYPKWLDLNLVRGNKVISEKFQKAKLEKARILFIDTIKEIYKDNSFNAKPNSFFCDWLCSVRSFCEHSKRFIKKWEGVDGY